MASEHEFQTSAAFIQALVRAIETNGHTAKMRAIASPALREALDFPAKQSWWPSTTLSELMSTLGQVVGDDGIRVVARTAFDNTMGSIITPLITVLMAVFGATPATLGKRVDSLLKVASQNVRTQWDDAGPKGGVLTIHYPKAVPRDFLALWRGTIEWGLDRTRQTTTIGKVTQSDDGRSLSYELSW